MSDGGHIAPPPPTPPEPVDANVVPAGEALDLASGSVEALLAAQGVGGAPISDLTATMTPWTLGQVNREETDGVEETAGP